MDAHGLTGPAPHADAAQFDLVIESVGADTAIAVVHRMMGPQVLGWCAPEDVWQETLAVAWRDREAHAWQDVATYRRWLFAIARNRVRDIARAMTAEKRGGAAKRELFADLGERPGAALSDILPPGSVTPSRLAAARERARVILEALAALPEDVEPVLRLHLLEDEPMDVVAERLGIGQSAAWHRYRRGAALYAQRLRALRSQVSLPRSEG